MLAVTCSFAQQYPDSYPNNGWGNSTNSYNNNDDQTYFPDDYYYDYPDDYYGDNYYQSYYNDYRNSIVTVDWNNFFRSYRLNRWQVEQIMMLNNMYGNFASWNVYYRHNPDRWYYDRFYALRQILGVNVYLVFQNNYYRGYDPIVYFQNYRRDHYQRRYYVMPRYRNVNINLYRLDRVKYHRDNGNHYGWNQPRNPHNPNGFKDNYRGNSGNNGGGYHNPNKNGGFRGNDTSTPRNEGGFRSGTNNSGTRDASPRNDGGVFQNPRPSQGNTSAPSNNGGFRSNDGGGSRTAEPRSQNSGGQRNDGFRTNFTRN